ncbi:MAG TPA: hypothetical protein PKM78_00020 [Anaerolineae bacterium]|nr:hypothetical protein [Anaerolineae bacterium]HNU03715.1 hypothetical protein [Anaerolineae bacterium]
MRSFSVRHLLAALLLGLLLTGPASSAWLAPPGGAIVAPNGGCDDGTCGR